VLVVLAQHPQPLQPQLQPPVMLQPPELQQSLLLLQPTLLVHRPSQAQQWL
jgi:hypothetical protein